MREIIKEILKEVASNKKEQGIEPTYTTLVELQLLLNERMRKELNDMWNEGKIKVGDIVKTKYIQLTEDE